MKNSIYILIYALFIGSPMSCHLMDEKEVKPADPSEVMAEDHSGFQEVHFSQYKFETLGFKVDTFPMRNLTDIVYANGQLEVPPQHEATITPILGGNVKDILVIEGDRVRKNQPLAYIAHPDFTTLQTDYQRAHSRLEFMEQEYERQKRLHEANVGAGQAFQQTASELKTLRVDLKGYETKLRQLHLNPEKIAEGEIYDRIPVRSPINGFVEKVRIQMGQYVQPQTTMFLVMNTDHIHADLMVFEKDVSKVHTGQTVTFTVESAPGSELTAEIYSVGRQFEENPKAIHIHADIKQKKDNLIPGMYINGKIQTTSERVTALPEEAIIEEEGASYIFIAEERNKNDETEWYFKMTEVRTGIADGGWVEIKPLEPIPQGAQVAWNNAYYLISEMKKSETSHSH
ncbi:efflux RND transporter periplasmic adaptor subunit [Membranicola marinus]|uniref:Efflux RND transporter periplasmic adaptor subunit n=1 Tax=Membranihabitans marinus TaxID=1227546 RepID=A0A953HYT3_9BACT|nr:efflux RND transporter periplasmic adaptor subunit [Membranihabitans marinus]MBY5959161.1 efflux RND transporter periplasmic adaptor subunit [Membranihabitans marinus]